MWTRCHGFYGNLVQAVVSRFRGGKDRQSLPELHDLFIVLYRSADVDIPRSQIHIADQAIRRIWNVYCLLTIKGKSPK